MFCNCLNTNTLFVRHFRLKRENFNLSSFLTLPRYLNDYRVPFSCPSLVTHPILFFRKPKQENQPLLNLIEQRIRRRIYTVSFQQIYGGNCLGLMPFARSSLVTIHLFWF